MDTRELAELGVLGSLAEESPATRKGIQDRLQHSFGRYWGAGSGALWPAVDDLDEAGCLERLPPERSVDNHPGEAYALTDSGRERLGELVRQPVDDFGLGARSHLMMKLGFLHHLPPDERAAELASLADAAQTARARLVEVRDDHDEQVADHDQYGFRRELLDLRLRILDVFLEWLSARRESVAGTA